MRNRIAVLRRCAALTLLTCSVLAASPPSFSQQPAPDSQAARQIAELRRQVDDLRELVLRLQRSVAELQAAGSALEYKVADGFLVFVEWRRDASNRPYFLTPALYLYDSHQDTLGFGLTWWLGQKQGAW